MKNQQSKECPQCGQEFTGRPNKMYCSNECKAIAFKTKNTDSESRKIIFPDTANPDSCPIQIDFPKKNDVVRSGSISVKLSESETRLLSTQAKECGVDISDFMRVKSLMDETNIFKLNETILQQQQEIDELKIKLSFYKKNRLLQFYFVYIN